MQYTIRLLVPEGSLLLRPRRWQEAQDYDPSGSAGHGRPKTPDSIACKKSWPPSSKSRAQAPPRLQARPSSLSSTNASLPTEKRTSSGARRTGPRKRLDGPVRAKAEAQRAVVLLQRAHL